MNKFGIVGYGIVGKATHLGLLNSQSVAIYDTTQQNILSVLDKCEYVFFCIPTNDHNDIEILIDLIKQIKQINPLYKVIIRSTVTIGTCAKIEEIIGESIIYIPEFLRERCWQEDCLNRPLVIGSRDKLPQWLEEENIILCSLEETEIIKMFSNNIASARVTLANHFYEISKAVGADYDRIVRAYFQINHDQNYLEVNESLRGFGGKCLPKDLEFLIDTMDKLKLPQTYFHAIKEDNQLWPTTVRKS